jgi:CMP-N-acetylneuraminic acid synthetase
MKKAEDVCVLVQARLSSQRCPQKMIRPFANSTLIDICMQKLVDSKIPNKNIWVSVYEPELIEICKKYPINIFKRSLSSAMSEGTPMTEIYEWWDKVPHKYVVLINACAPMMKKETMENFFFDYLKIDNCGMFGVVEKRNYFWNNNDVFLTPLSEAVMNTKTANIVKEAAHCLYASSMSSIGNGIWMGDFSKPGDIKLWTMEEKEIFDIDYEWEFELYENMYKSLNFNKQYES